MKQVVAPLSTSTTAGFPDMRVASLMSEGGESGFGIAATPSCNWDGRK
jgi:hypothetical protein